MKPEETFASRPKGRVRRKSSEPFGSWLSEAEWILAIDTATEAISIALFDGQTVVAESIWPARRHHTVELAPAVEDLLRRADVKPSKIKAVGVTQGPGSFTAIRIGIAFSLGFALPHNLPVVGIPTFEILARAQPVKEKEMIAVIHAGRGRIAYCRFRAVAGKWKAEEERVSTWEELGQVAPRRACLCGEIDLIGRTALAKRRDLKLSPPSRNPRRAGYLAEMVAERLRDPVTLPMILQPVYLPTSPAEGEKRVEHGR
jgi:tRNA threonylcarbamoyladenosine biosynthesis protein TsaB